MRSNTSGLGLTRQDEVLPVFKGLTCQDEVLPVFKVPTRLDQL